MARMSMRFTSHRLKIILMLVLAGGILGVFLPQQSTARASAAQPATDSGTHVTVLLLHGLEGSSKANCTSGNYDRWGGFLQLNAGGGFAGLSWSPSLLHTLKYYSGDTGCSDDMNSNQGTNCNVGGTCTPDPHCNGYYESNTDANVETNNEDIRHIACRFYWYIYNNYTRWGLPVNILAHSMGGIIAEWALSMAAAHNTTLFPFPLLVYNVVTLSTPFQGVPDNIFGQLNQVSANIACGVCFEGQQLEVGSNSPNSIIGQLNSFSSTEGYWTAIGSYGTLPSAMAAIIGAIPIIGPILVPILSAACDEVNITSSLSLSNSTVNPGPSLSSAAVVYYNQCIFHEEPAPGQFETPNGSIPLPNAASYQDDVSKYLDYSGYQGTVSNLGSYQFRTLPHPFAKAIEALGITRGPDSYPLSPYPVYDVPGGGAFFTVWMQLSGPAGPLGQPTDVWNPFQGGEAQDFQGGGIYWSAATGNLVVQGPIYTEYVNGVGGPNGVLNFPTTGVLGIAGGSVSYFYGTLCGGPGPNNSGSAIYYTSTTGAHWVGGCIYNHYWHDLGGPGGNANFNLGFPTSDVQTISGGYVSYFYNNLCGARGPNNSGSAIYNSSSGTYMVGGCIYNKYWGIGGPNSQLNFPTSDVQVIAGGYVSYFAGQKCGSGGPSGSGSAIYYSTNADEVQGCIYAEYVGVMNGPGGPLGFPVTDEQGIASGRVSYFSGQSCAGGGPNGSGSAIYFNSSAHEVQGCIYHEYVSVLGGPSNPNGLGFPIWDETGVASGRASYFSGQRCGGGGPAFGGVVSGSAIFWTSGTGAHEVQGCIYDKYWHMPLGINGENQDGPGGALGFPLADESGVTSGCTLLPARYSAFQHGAIYFYNGTGYEVQGSIYTTYQDYGGAGGVMGLPITDEFTYDSAGDRESEFENGYILYTKATGHITVSRIPSC